MTQIKTHLLFPSPVFECKIDNYKDQLMRYYQKTFNGKYPTYAEVKVEEIPCNENDTKIMQIIHLHINSK